MTGCHRRPFKTALAQRGMASLAANALLDARPVSQTLAKVDASTLTDDELAAIALGMAPINAQAH
jgi:hypothetical protein